MPRNAGRSSISAAIVIGGSVTAAGRVATWHAAANSAKPTDVTSKAPQEGSTTVTISVPIAAARPRKA
ncbi:MAG TPA: hypothetical protein VGV87_08825 [Blastocatellia bacterium]|nr:hypothetical protein [Blastocatellia bacterium]